MTPTTKDIELLNSLYEGRKAYHGELHDHAKTGGKINIKIFNTPIIFLPKIKILI